MRDSEGPASAIDRAGLALTGRSVGDAFGDQFFVDATIAEQRIAERTLPDPPWRYTDDTEMAFTVMTVLRRYGRIDQTDLASTFAAHYDRSRSLLRQVVGGVVAGF